MNDDNRLPFAKELSDGSAAGQADVVWHAADQTLADGHATTLDLTALVQSMFGDTISIALGRVKAILLINRNTTGSAFLSVGGAGSNPWSAPFGTTGDTVKVMPESPLLMANLRDGWSVDTGSKTLGLQQPSAATCSSNIAILGTAPTG